MADKTIQTHNRQQPNRSTGQTISNLASVAASGRGSSVSEKRVAKYKVLYVVEYSCPVSE